MNTKILSAGNADHIKICADKIIDGEVIAFPTETVYGLGADALNEKAVQKIFTIKNRQKDNPFIVHVSSIDEIHDLIYETPDIFYELANKFWPGPLTMIMKKKSIIPDNVTSGLDTVAIRIPGHPAALALLQACGKPVAAPSANPSGKPSPTKAIHVMNDLSGKIPFILDGGNCRIGLESTVLDISGKIPRVLRPGGLTINELKTVIKNVLTNDSDAEAYETPRSPGMKYRHYAPIAPLTVVLGPPAKTAEYINQKMSSKTAALMFDDHKIEHPFVVTFGSATDYISQASRLYNALRAFDKMNIIEIYAQMPEENDKSNATVNRLKKAAGNNIIDLSNME